MIYRSTIRIIEPKKYRSGTIPGDTEHVVRATVEWAGGLRKGGFYDALASDARAYVDTSDPWLQSIGFRLHGMFVRVDKFGVSQLYQVANCAVGERFASTGETSHLEVDLEEVKGTLGG